MTERTVPTGCPTRVPHHYLNPGHKKARTIAGPGHELDVRGRNIGRRRSVLGKERTPRRQALELNNYTHAHHVR